MANKARSIMVQGTMSNAGKSLLVAGLCRVLAQDGFRVMPFKSQNMALNSYVTADGLEMGRAQVMQAEAAGVEPNVLMNPILLKPTSSTGSQVIVRGEIDGTMSAQDYYAYKGRLRDQVQAAYDELAAQCDIVVLEGAGSPAEINLRDDDIVNMGMARMANAPVLLAGDIDLGGVFAQLYGTVSLLEPEERAMVKGLVVNKFRGDAEILRPGLEPLERLCGVPVVGVVPYLDLDLDDEDSLSPRLAARACDRAVDVAAIRLPHLSNFTDLNALERHESVSVRYVQRPADLGRPDLVVIPGTKNTMGDVRWLHESGMAACIQALAAGGTPVVGICGGYQMLGEQLDDPLGVEEGGSMKGLGLLPMRTVFTAEKRRVREEAVLAANEGFFAPLAGVRLEGYEIHMGTTEGSCAPSVMLRTPEGERPDGGVCGSVMGTYLHGFFDAPELVEKLADALLVARGLPAAGGSARAAGNTLAYKQAQYDRLADGLRSALDMQAIYRIIEEGV